jgi:hypothetical protein
LFIIEKGDTLMSDVTPPVTLPRLISYGQKFNSAVKGMISQDPALLAQAQEVLEAALPALDAIAAAAPQPDQATLDADEILRVADEKAQQAQMKEFLKMFGDNPNAIVLGPNGPVEINQDDDTEEVDADPAATQAKLEAAAALINTFNEKAAPSHIQMEEALASLFVNILPADQRDSVVPDEVRNADISAGFAAQNAPVLAAAFAPKP